MSKSKLSYSEKLRDPRWQKKRLDLLESAGWKCQFSGCENENENPTLHVHHHVYLPGLNPWEYEDWAYSVLCDKCHEVAQSQMEKNHCLLAKHQNLRASLVILDQLESEEQKVLIDSLSDMLAITRRDKKVAPYLFFSLSEFAKSAASAGIAFGQEEKK